VLHLDTHIPHCLLARHKSPMANAMPFSYMCMCRKYHGVRDIVRASGVAQHHRVWLGGVGLECVKTSICGDERDGTRFGMWAACERSLRSQGSRSEAALARGTAFCISLRDLTMLACIQMCHTCRGVCSRWCRLARDAVAQLGADASERRFAGLARG
jgi:hypothetical protein